MNFLLAVLSATISLSFGYPFPISTIETSSWARNSVIASGHLFIGTVSGFEVYDTTDPTQSVQIAIVNTGSFAMSLAVGRGGISTTKKTLLYVASWNKGIIVYDVSSVNEIKLVSETPLPGNAMDISLVGTIGYVASDSEGLHVVNFGAFVPTVLGSYKFKDSRRCRHVEINKNVVYVSTSAVEDAISILNVRNYNSITEIGSFPTTDKAREIVLSENKAIAYATVDQTGLQIFSIKNPSHPQLLSTTSLNGPATSIVVQSGIAYVGLIGSGLAIIDVNQVGSPTVITNYNTPGHVYGVYKFKSTLYVADYFGGLILLDVTPSAEV